MMLSKPRPSDSASEAKTDTKKKSPQDAVADLERRLAMLGTGSQHATTNTPEVISTEEEKDANSFALNPAAAAGVKGGKNALLARIMAAQERAKQAQQKQSQQQDETLLQLDEEPPTFDENLLPPSSALEPPAFDVAQLPPQAPPPAFDHVEDSVMAQVRQTSAIAPPVAPPATFPVATPSAPALEDLLDFHSATTPSASFHDVPLVPPPTVVAPPEEEDLSFLAGLSEEERREMLEEQRRIMQQIEQERTVDAASLVDAAADAFDQRSAPAVARIASEPPSAAQRRTIRLGGGQEVALHGQERTRDAIKNGTAILVQCMNCENWMQVTHSASLMLCPVCQVVSPVERPSSAMTKEEAMQLAADQKLAEQLQNEEYKRAGREEGTTQRTREAVNSSSAAAASSTQSWWDWLGLGGTEAAPPAAAAPPASAAPRRAPAAAAPPRYAPPTLQGPARTGGEEVITFSRSYDEQEGLLSANPDRHSPVPGSRPMPAARVAQRQPIFSCVADSISTAATSFTTALATQTLTEDDEGNVHGVDSSSLLAVTTAGRESQQKYQSLREDEH